MASRQAPRTGDPIGRRASSHTPLRALTALALAVLSLPLSVASVSAAGTTFEIDGDLSGPRDWDSVSHVVAVDPDPADGLQWDDIFQASKEEGDPPTTWGLRDGNTETGGDVTRVLSTHEVDTDGDVWFHLGFFRSEDGTGAFVVELNQLPNTSAGMPNRSEGDVRIAFTQDNGNTQLTGLTADTWASGSWSPSTALAGAYQTATGQAGTFGELAINLTGAGLQPTCGEGFTAVNMRSRSSSQETASLKDYVKPLGVAISARCRDVRVEKYDATTGLPLSGARFRLYADDGATVGSYDSADSPVGSAVDADQGADANSYTWAGLAWGSYFVVETAHPTGYGADEDLDAQGAKRVVLGEDTPNGPAVVEFRNPQARARITVAKVDAETDLPLTGASFRLFADDGDEVFDEDDAPVGPAEPADGGPDGNEYTSGELAYGTYFVKETVIPAGYGMDPAANTDGQVGTFDDNAKAVRLTPDDAGNAKQVQFANPPLDPASDDPQHSDDPQQPSTVRAVKKDEQTGEVLAGATFQAWTDGNRNGVADESDSPLGDSKVSNGNGVVAWTGLAFGHYLVEEVAPPAGYGLPEESTQPVVLDATNAGQRVTLTFLDPPLGAVSVAKIALERDAAGQWVASDGEVGFGDEVKYVLTARASGAKVHHHVEVSDFVPGFDPADKTSTADASYVAGSARCLGVRCRVSFDEDTHELTWRVGELRGEERTMEFVVEMPRLPRNPEFVDGELVETVVNVATLSWQEHASPPTARRAASLVARTLESNEVVTSIVERPEVLPTTSAEVPDERPQADALPDTGAPADGGPITTVAAICLLVGAWLTLASRRRGFVRRR